MKQSSKDKILLYLILFLVFVASALCSTYFVSKYDLVLIKGQSASPIDERQDFLLKEIRPCGNVVFEKETCFVKKGQNLPDGRLLSVGFESGNSLVFGSANSKRYPHPACYKWCYGENTTENSGSPEYLEALCYANCR